MMDALIEVLQTAVTRGVKLSAEAGHLHCYARKGALTDGLRAGIQRYKPEILALLAQDTDLLETLADSNPVLTDLPFPANQRQILNEKVHALHGVGHRARCVRLVDKLRPADLHTAWEETLHQHPLLAARVAEREGAYYYRFFPDEGGTPEALLSERGDKKPWAALLAEAVRQPFDLKHGSMVRVEYLLDEAVVLVTAHAVLCDEPSMDLIMTSLLNAYLGRTQWSGEGAGGASGFRNFVTAEKDYLLSPDAKVDGDYWGQALRGEMPISGILPDRVRQDSSSFGHANVLRELGRDMSLRLRAFAQAYGVPLESIFLAVLYLLLHRYTGQTETLIAMRISLRDTGPFAQEVGHFDNHLPLLLRCTPQESFGVLLRKVQTLVLDALYHRHYPACMIREESGSAISPQVGFSFVESVTPVHATRPEVEDLRVAATAGHDLTLVVEQHEDTLRLKLVYDAGLYQQSSAERVLDHYLVLLGSVRENLGLPLAECPLLAPGEENRLLRMFNDPGTAPSGDRCLHEFFVEQAESHPEKTAVDCAGQQLSYGELLERSRRIARYLRQTGVQPDGLVGVCLERSPSMLVVLLGILQAGAAYVPLDPKYPVERLVYMIEDSRVVLVITQQSLVRYLREFVPPAKRLVAVDDQAEFDFAFTVEARNGSLSHTGMRSSNLAYVIYTSGSTGNPKGVAIEHRSAVSLIRWAGNVFTGEELRGVLASTSVCFDLSVFEMFVPLSFGGTVILVENALALSKTTSQQTVTLINTVPSAIEELLRSGGVPDSVLAINLAGEFLKPALVDRIYRETRVKKVYDLYGPSEDTTYSTFALRRASTVATIGVPITNTRVYILDELQQLQPVGVAGELHLAGDGLARGYLHRKELTQAKFLSNPFEPGERMYRTGDMARWLPDGTIQYLGRIDTQVKVRGFRIELGEIEACLNQHILIQESVVIARGELAEARLVAFYQVTDSIAGKSAQLDDEDLRSYLMVVLPEYMVPAVFIDLPSIPLTANGKVDRKALAQIDDRSVRFSGSYTPPRNDRELQLAAIWGEVLKLPVEQISVHDSFFGKGGNSLLAARLVTKVRSQFDVELPLSTIFQHKTIALLVIFLSQAETSRVPDLLPVPRELGAKFPLSYMQESLWFLHQLGPRNAAYHVPLTVTFYGGLDTLSLERALNVVVARHESLRMVFGQEGGRPWQQVQASVSCVLNVVDVSHYPGSLTGEEAVRRICSEDNAPFDLARGPLLRAKLLRVHDEEHVLMLNMHHIVSDGWSLNVLLNEVDTLLTAEREGKLARLPTLPVQYLDWVLWQRDFLKTDNQIKTQLAYWQQKLAGAPDMLELPADFARSSLQTFEGRQHRFALTAEVCNGLRGLGEVWGGTLFMVLLSVFKVLLHRYTGQTDICVGTPIANRQQEKIEGLIGMFVNTLALRDRVHGGDSFEALFTRVRSTCLEAYEHQDAPFERVVDAVQPQRNLSASPLFQVMLVVQNLDWGRASATTGIELYPLDLGASKFDVSLEFTEDGGGLSGSLEYCTALFRPDRMERMAEHFVGLCRAVVASPKQAVGDLEYLGAGERLQLLKGFNQTEAWYPKELCIHELIDAQMTQQPEATALVYGDREMSYGELAERSGRLAQYLQGLGVGPDSIVGLCLERSLEMVVGILGIVRAGGAYLPLDPEYPDERLAYMAEDSRCPVVLTQGSLVVRLRGVVPAGTPVLSLDTGWAEVLAGSVAGVVPSPGVRPEHLCYVIYTSGSTGRPKGVLVEHGGLVNRIHWMQKSYGLEASDTVLQKTPYSFDVSVWEFFWPLMAGARLILAVPGGHRDVAYLGALLAAQPITVLHFVPSMLQIFLEHAPGVYARVRHVFASGEALGWHTVQAFEERFPEARLHNLYGPTEASIDVSFCECRGLRDGVVPIGRPIDNHALLILDGRQQVVPVGVAGELHIAGVGLARGYLQRPELTAERFVDHPFQPGSRMYRTGDLARWLPDGNVQYLGRVDTQVKVHGFRIELGEIEARLNQHPEVEESVVVTQGEGEQRRLVGFYRGTTAVPEGELRTHLQTILPEYMVPAALVWLAALPLSANGKADRKALAALALPTGPVEAKSESTAPRNSIEQQMVDLWAELLGRDPVTIGIHDSFFHLGGHSLLATRLLAKIRTRMQVELPLKIIFERNTVAGLAEVIRRTTETQLPALVPMDRTQWPRLPLSFAQERIWFLDQMEPGTAGYNLPTAVHMHGRLPVEQLELAFRMILARHEALRTVFPADNGQPFQLILDDPGFILDRIDLSHLPTPAERQHAARDLCQREAATPFDLATGPLLRAKLLHLHDEEHVLMLNMHHIVSDGWSYGILLRELQTIVAALHQHQSPKLPTLPIQYADYTLWQRHTLQTTNHFDTQLAYWQQKLAGAPDMLELPADFARSSLQTFEGRQHRFALTAEVCNGLRGLGEVWGGTLFMVLLSVFKVLLHRYTGQTDICVGTPIANRQQEKIEGLIGMFVNTLALRDRVHGGDSFEALFTRVRSTCLEAYEHQDAPFERVVDAVQPQRNLSASPLFQVMLVVQNLDWGRASATTGIELYPLDLGASKFDVSLEFTEDGGGLSGSLEYCTALFRPDRMERMAEHFVGLCRAVVASPKQAVGDLEYLGAGERLQLLKGFNQTEAWYPKELCIHELIDAQMTQQPEATALVYGDREMSYGELAERSGRLAQYLQGLGVGPDSIVGLCLERSLEMVVGILGIVRAGGAYLPLDPEYPDERLAYMAEDSRCPVVLTQGSLVVRLRGVVPAGTPVLSLDTGWAEVLAGSVAGVVPSPGVRPEHLCYVIYTSGSTGRPKGVLVEHGGLVNRIHWMQKSYGLEASDTVLQKTPYSFDVSVWEFFWPLMAGARLILAVPGGHRDVAYLGALLAAQPITVLHFVPSMLQIFLEHAPGVYARVRHVFASGEALGWHTVQAFEERFPEARLHNLYGPTEASIDVSFCECRGLRDGVVPIGRPIDNHALLILDGRQQVVPVGVAGELHIAGVGLARGYLQRPELTAERFVDHPFQPGSRMYRTGDLARWLPDGNVQYLGRVDTQVKVHGFRIELGEIEARLNQHPEVEESVVVTQGEGEQRRLVGFYRGTTAVPEGELRTHLQTILPEYMVPAALVWLAALPLSANGKADRKALAALALPTGPVEAKSESTAPRNSIEQQMVDLWAELLGRDPVTIGIHDSFFHLGGHSLLATRLLAKIRTRMQVELPLKIIFERNTVAGLAEVIRRTTETQLPALVPMDRTQWPRLPLSFAQERIWFLDQMEPGTAGYNLPTAVHMHGRLPVEQLELAFRMILARHEALRTVFPADNGQPFQLILDDPGFILDRIDLSHLPTPAERQHAARDLCQREAATPFDLATGPLLRAKLLHLHDEEHVLMLNMHHIVSDGWSYGILLRELQTIVAALHQHQSPKLPTLPIQYADYTLWQRHTLQTTNHFDTQLAYWQQKLAGSPDSISFALDFARPKIQSFAGATYEQLWDSALVVKLERLGERYGSTLFMVLLATFKVLVHRYTGQDDFCVGTTVANRQNEEVEGLIGMFVNMLALRDQLDSAQTFGSFLSGVRTTCVQAYNHQGAPFERVVDRVRPRRNPSITPIFQLTLTLQTDDSRAAYSNAMKSVDVERQTSKFEIGFDFIQSDTGLSLTVEYCTSIYSPTTIVRITNHLRNLCEAVTADPERALGDYDFAGAGERLALLEQDTSNRAGYPWQTPLHELFGAQAARTPESAALECGTEVLSYKQVELQSNQLAHYLAERGVGAGSRVAVLATRSLPIMVALLAVLKCGAAYVPIDPTTPDSRVQFMLEDAGACVLLHHGTLSKVVLGSSLTVIDLAAEVDSIGRYPQITPQNTVRSSEVAYIIYTSGSTGTPKGVVVEHRSVVNYAMAAIRVYELTAVDRTLQFSSLSFDAAAEEIFPTLFSGATLVLRPRDLLNTIDGMVARFGELRISLLSLPTAVWHAWVAAMEETVLVVPASLRAVIIGGERALPERVRQWKRAVGSCVRLLNTYGPTEATIVATIAELTWGDPDAPLSQEVSIGRPVNNVQVYILDHKHNLQPFGVPGELCIAGEGLARGYLDRPELTASKFIPHPFRSDLRLYCTGDLARRFEDGSLQYLGRVDTQIKIRGFRVELGEIEACLHQHCCIREAVVLVRGPQESQELVAFFVPNSPGGQKTPSATLEELREFLARGLPAYMVPSAFVCLEAMPLTSSGKVDRRSLSAMEVTRILTAERIAPRNMTEDALVKIWAEVLGVSPEQLGIRDNFFTLGGHSLAAVRLMAKINRHFGELLSLATIFSAPDIATMAQLIVSQHYGYQVLVPLRAEGAGVPIFAVPGAGGNVTPLKALSGTLSPRQPLYALQAIGLDGKQTPLETVEETARVNIEAMQTIQASGPYTLVGHSYGGVVAYEMARQLVKANEQVTSLFLLDSVAPSLVQTQPQVSEREDLVEAFSEIARLSGVVLKPGFFEAARIADEKALVTLVRAQGVEVDFVQFASLVAVFSANLRSYRAYQPRLLGKHVETTLFLAAKEQDSRPASFPDDLGWKALLGDSMKIVPVDEDHFSILSSSKICVSSAVLR